jgi:anhydro-N-acetylmuramic acid kinase
LRTLIDIASKPSRRIVGLMTGTSADGVDAVLVDIEGFGPTMELELLAQKTYPLPGELRADLFLLFQPEARVDDLCRVMWPLGQCWPTPHWR